MLNLDSDWRIVYSASSEGGGGWTSATTSEVQEQAQDALEVSSQEAAWKKMTEDHWLDESLVVFENGGIRIKRVWTFKTSDTDVIGWIWKKEMEWPDLETAKKFIEFLEGLFNFSNTGFHNIKNFLTQVMSMSYGYYFISTPHSSWLKCHAIKFDFDYLEIREIGRTPTKKSEKFFPWRLREIITS